MRYNSPAFLAWQEAELRASNAERQLFAKLCDPQCASPPTREEVLRTRALRECASLQMKQMLDEMRTVAESLKFATPAAGAGIGTRNRTDPDSAR